MQIIALKAAKAAHPTLAPKTQGSLACVSAQPLEHPLAL
jgi:hypothetical protein